jgi:hypothetical protein
MSRNSTFRTRILLALAVPAAMAATLVAAVPASARAITGTTDVATGDSKARLTEEFIGIDSATGKAGTLRLRGTVVQDGSTLTMVVKERVIGGTGAFTGMRGHIRYEGVDTSLVGGAGRYRSLLR